MGSGTQKMALPPIFVVIWNKKNYYMEKVNKFDNN
jgi:hypothetical protein